MRMKHWLHFLGCVFVVIIVQGCAGTPTVLSTADRQSLQALPLFAADGTPQFSFELACNGDLNSCNTIRHSFEKWAHDRHVHMQITASVDTAPHADRQADAPYRLALGIRPLVVSSYDKVYSKGDNLSGGYTPPKVGYRASLYVFDAVAGKQLRTISFHEEREADFKADANSYLRAELNTFIADMDPSYRSR